MGVSGDEYKCAEYRDGAKTNDLTYKKLITGFSVSIFNETYLRESVTLTCLAATGALR